VEGCGSLLPSTFTPTINLIAGLFETAAPFSSLINRGLTSPIQPRAQPIELVLALRHQTVQLFNFRLPLFHEVPWAALLVI